ncbi:hypothetical protein J6590_084229 [Homalodisca vitripennis]|nr:hypothetical protein J6590_101959 [Homalodisca vitripennis]KAG8314813.1 hypothetical protein J6590_084229 [Homalodisca vitripennis]
MDDLLSSAESVPLVTDLKFGDISSLTIYLVNKLGIGIHVQNGQSPARQIHSPSYSLVSKPPVFSSVIPLIPLSNLTPTSSVFYCHPSVDVVPAVVSSLQPRLSLTSSETAAIDCHSSVDIVPSVFSFLQPPLSPTSLETAAIDYNSSVDIVPSVFSSLQPPLSSTSSEIAAIDCHSSVDIVPPVVNY